MMRWYGNNSSVMTLRRQAPFRNDDLAAISALEDPVMF